MKCVNDAPGDETERGEEREREGEASSAGWNDRRHEPPHLKHDVRHRDHEAHDERDLNVEPECLARLRVDQRRPRRQGPPGGPEDEVDDLPNEREPDDDAHDHGDGRSDQPLPEVVEPIEDREVGQQPVEWGRGTG